MTSFVWFIAINSILGLIAMFVVMPAIIFVFIKKYGKKACKDTINDLSVQSDMIYESKFGDVQKGQYLSVMITIVLWEIMVPTELYHYWLKIKEKDEAS